VDHPITVAVPAQTGSLGVLRAVVASVGARLDFAVEDIEDLRLAVDEACGHLLAMRPPPTVIHLRLSLSGRRIEAVAWADAPVAGWPPPDPSGSITWQVLSALTEDAAMGTEDGAPAIRFAKGSLYEGSAG
jgi:serine/threonine-protein kinase RsbW